MKVTTSTDVVAISVRVQPGEDLLEVLYLAVQQAGATSAALASTAGSLEYLRYGVVSIADDGVPRYTQVVTLNDAIEVTGLQGHVGTNADNSPTCHLHGTFGLPDGSVVAGHVYEARALVTVEMTLIGSRDVGWMRSEESYLGDHIMPILLPVSAGHRPSR